MTRPLGHKVQTLPSVTVAPRPKGVFAFSWLLNRQRCMFWKHQRVPLSSPPRTGPSLPSQPQEGLPDRRRPRRSLWFQPRGRWCPPQVPPGPLGGGGCASVSPNNDLFQN